MVSRLALRACPSQWGGRKIPRRPKRTLMKYPFKKPGRAPAAPFFILPFYHTTGMSLGALFLRPRALAWSLKQYRRSYPPCPPPAPAQPVHIPQAYHCRLLGRQRGQSCLHPGELLQKLGAQNLQSGHHVPDPIPAPAPARGVAQGSGRRAGDGAVNAGNALPGALNAVPAATNRPAAAPQSHFVPAGPPDRGSGHPHDPPAAAYAPAALGHEELLKPLHT